VSRHLRFEKLLEPYHIGSVKTRNRIIKSAAGLRYWGSGENPVSEKIKCLYEAYARGGVGLVIMESPTGRTFQLDREKHIKDLSQLTRVIHQQGCSVFVQLTSMANWKLASSTDMPRAASPVCIYSEMDNHNTMPRELTIPEIKEMVEKFGNNAVGAQKAGFDGVEVNAASSHLLHSFLSPFWNKRHDAYGCTSLENRTRFLVEIIREIKKRLGWDFPVSTLINGIEIGRFIGVEDCECLTLEDSLGIARILEEAGADAIQVRSQWIGRHDASFLTDHLCYPEPPVPLKSFPKELDMSHRGAGANAFLAQAVKKVVSIPVITVGRLDPKLGERILQEGKADFIAMTRRLFADPELPNKLALGRVDDIAPCTSCTCCKAEDAPRRCRINAALGTEHYLIERATKQKRVVIIGGGPAGLEAARVAALRGHEVTLFEKSSRLGGLLPLAALVKGLEIEDLPSIVRYLKRQMTKLGVKTVLGKEVTPSLIEGIKPDVVLVATGGIPAVPEISGINGRNVVSNADLHRMLKFFIKFIGPKTLRWLTRLWMPIGKRVVIIGGDIQGCELAEFLVKRGRKVTIVDTADVLGEGMISHLKLQLFWWFRKKSVAMMPGVKPVAITNKGLIVLTKEGYKQTIEADSIIPAIPMKPNTELLKTLQGKVPEIYAIGDCSNPRLIVDAIADGWKIANSI